jgi:hypothetical protein
MVTGGSLFSQILSLADVWGRRLGSHLNLKQKKIAWGRGSTENGARMGSTLELDTSGRETTSQ